MATTATTTHVPAFVRLGNLFTRTMLRAGIRLNGFGRPMYLLTVRGRKSGQPRTTPVVVIEQDGQRYLVAPYGIVDWVRNLRAAGRATLSWGRRHETVIATELSPEQAAPVIRSILPRAPKVIQDYFDVTPESSLEEFIRDAPNHPMFAVHPA